MTQTLSIAQVITKMKEENGTCFAPQSKPCQVLTSQRNLPAESRQVLAYLQKYPTIEDFFKVFNPKRQLYICQYPAYCITGPSPTLAQIDIMYGPFTSAKWLVPLIADVSLCCGLKEDASEDQLQLTATAILERYKWLKAGELMLFFFNFKAGFYERFYSYFDPQAIIRSMKPFLQKRNLAIDAYERDLSTYKGVPQ